MHDDAQAHQFAGSSDHQTITSSSPTNPNRSQSKTTHIKVIEVNAPYNTTRHNTYAFFLISISLSPFWRNETTSASRNIVDTNLKCWSDFGELHTSFGSIYPNEASLITLKKRVSISKNLVAARGHNSEHSTAHV